MGDPHFFSLVERPRLAAAVGDFPKANLAALKYKMKNEAPSPPREIYARFGELRKLARYVPF